MKNVYYHFKYKQLIKFVYDNLSDKICHNKWFEYQNFKVYIRVSHRMIDNLRVQTIEIGSVEVDENNRGKKIFTRFLNEIENEFKDYIIFIENILNPRLYTHLIDKRNYQELKYLPQCLYLKQK